MRGEPVAAEAATAEGRRLANTMANVAARNASERMTDQCSAEDRFTTRPLAAPLRLGNPVSIALLSRMLRPWGAVVLSQFEPS